MIIYEQHEYVTNIMNSTVVFHSSMTCYQAVGIFFSGTIYMLVICYEVLIMWTYYDYVDNGESFA